MTKAAKETCMVFGVISIICVFVIGLSYWEVKEHRNKQLELQKMLQLIEKRMEILREKKKKGGLSV